MPAAGLAFMLRAFSKPYKFNQFAQHRYFSVEITEHTEITEHAEHAESTEHPDFFWRCSMCSTISACSAFSESITHPAHENHSRHAEAALEVGPIQDVFHVAIETHAMPVVHRQRIARAKISFHVPVENVESIEGERQEQQRVLADGRQVECYVEPPTEPLCGHQCEDV